VTIWARFEVVGPDETRLTIGGDIPGIDDAVAAEVRTMMDRSTANIRSLVESGM
jgi:hypothetical protein